MAINIAGEKQNNPIARVAVIVISVILLVFATYYLFFTSPPQIDVLVPVELQNISQISGLDVDPSEIIKSPEYKALKEQVGPPELGQFGRENPFAKF
jgi:hypothetical protein